MARTLEKRPVPAYTADWLIAVNGGNPKRPNTACWYAFQHFFNAKTVRDFAELHGKGFRSEIQWCAERGYISLLDPVAVAEAATPAARLEASAAALKAAEAALVAAKAAAEAAELEAIEALEAEALAAEALEAEADEVEALDLEDADAEA